MPEQNEVIINHNNKWLSIVITQSVCVAIILLSLIAMKYLFSGTFNSVKQWYEINVCNDTDVNEVLGSDGVDNEI